LPMVLLALFASHPADREPSLARHQTGDQATGVSNVPPGPVSHIALLRASEDVARGARMRT
jgi:hypothetical protein